jgi:hypothetical protein
MRGAATSADGRGLADEALEGRTRQAIAEFKPADGVRDADRRIRTGNAGFTGV